jgi:hypothetical protein
MPQSVRQGDVVQPPTEKLGESMTQAGDDLSMAWGIHIVESPDMVWILWTMICVLTVCLGPIVAYIVLKGDVQSVTCVGDLAVSVLTLLWMCMKICEWSQ